MRRATGFTFLELLIALTIFMTGMLSVLQIFPANRRLITQTGQTAQAVFLAQEQMEALIAMPYDSLTPGASFQPRAAIVTDSTSPLAIFERQTAVTLVNGSWQTSATDQGLKRIDVTLYWQENGISRQHSISTYVYDH